MKVHISFIVGTLDDALAIVANHEDFGFVADYLSAELQSVSICDDELQWIEGFEKNKQESEMIYGNLIRRELIGETIRLTDAFPYEDDPEDFGEPQIVSLSEIKDIIKRWKASLLEFRSK